MDRTLDLYLKLLGPEDWIFVRDLYADPATMAWAASPDNPDGTIALSEADWPLYCGFWCRQAPERWMAVLMKRDEAGDMPLGLLSFFRESGEDFWRAAVLLQAQERGRGLGRAAWDLLLEEAFVFYRLPLLELCYEQGRGELPLTFFESLGFVRAEAAAELETETKGTAKAGFEAMTSAEAPGQGESVCLSLSRAQYLQRRS